MYFGYGMFHISREWEFENTKANLPAGFRPAYAAARGRPIYFWLVKAEHFSHSSDALKYHLELNKEYLTYHN
jgi:hypothetical protein